MFDKSLQKWSKWSANHSTWVAPMHELALLWSSLLEYKGNEVLHLIGGTNGSLYVLKYVKRSLIFAIETYLEHQITTKEFYLLDKKMTALAVTY